MKYLNWRQRRSLAAYRRRLAEFTETQQLPPDGRDSDLKARGAVLDWRRRVKANEARRAERRRWMVQQERERLIDAANEQAEREELARRFFAEGEAAEQDDDEFYRDLPMLLRPQAG